MLWGCYITLDDASIIEAFVVDIGQWPHGEWLLVDGNFNTDLAAPEGNTHNKDITSNLTTMGLENMISHFIPQRKKLLRDGQTWSMIYGGPEVRSRTYYILGTDHRLIQNMLFRDARYNTYHYLVLGYLHGAATTNHL